MKIVLEPWSIMPTRAHEYDAGLDLYSANDDVYIYPGESELFDTGVHVQLPKNTVGFLQLVGLDGYPLPDIVMLSQLADAYGVTLDELVGRE